MMTSASNTSRPPTRAGRRWRDCSSAEPKLPPFASAESPHLAILCHDNREVTSAGRHCQREGLHSETRSRHEHESCLGRDQHAAAALTLPCDAATSALFSWSTKLNLFDYKLTFHPFDENHKFCSRHISRLRNSCSVK